MKFLCYLTALTLLVAVQTTTPEEDAKALHKIEVECQNETVVSVELKVKALINGDGEDDPKLKQQVLCVCKKRGLITESGELVVDAWKAQMKKINPNNENGEKIINECVVKKDTPVETAFNALKCVEKKLNGK
jgi:hypothetical protein